MKTSQKKEYLVVDFRPLRFDNSESDVAMNDPPSQFLANTWIVFYPEDGATLTVIKYMGGMENSAVRKLYNYSQIINTELNKYSFTKFYIYIFFLYHVRKIN